jgi:hypothetical protein
MVDSRKAKLVLLAITLHFALLPVIAQGQCNDQLTRKVSAFKVSGTTAHVILQRLAGQYKIPIGLESLPEEETPKGITVEVKEGTVRDVLDAVVEADPRYEWKVVDGVINVFPRERKDSLLTTVVSDYKIYQLNRDEIKESITEVPEIKSKLSSLGIQRRDVVSLPMESKQLTPFTLNLHNVTMRKILNEVLRESGSHYWVVLRYGEQSKFVTVNIAF